jgi:heterodisulfide reductase subunit B
MVMDVEVLFYPGCSLKNSYPEFEMSALEACGKLGMELVEIPKWACCGVNPSLASDNIMRHLGAIRSLISAREKAEKLGAIDVVTVCSMCYNVMKRINLILRDEPDTLENVNAFIDDLPDYDVGLRVTHLLTLLEEKGFDSIRERVENPLKGLKVACYYGCALLRPNKPQGVPIDDHERPTILEKLMRSLGSRPVEFQFKAECCGNYHIVLEPGIVEMRTRKILDSARAVEADIVVSSCPLCTYNLEQGDESPEESDSVPVVFFTQLLALALGAESHLPAEIEEMISKKIGV